MAAFVLSDVQQVDLAVNFVDEAGNPAQVDGTPTWASTDESIVVVTAAADGLSATAVATGDLGTAQVSVRADADLGSGTTELIGLLDVEVVAGEAVTAVISPGAPTHK